MSVTCPEGHQSEATDYCDTCGTPIAASSGAGGPSVDPGSGPSSAAPGPVLPQAADGSVLDLDLSPAPAQTCPHCGAANVADALFCEACGYDFTTGAAPLDAEPAVPAHDEPGRSSLSLEEPEDDGDGEPMDEEGVDVESVDEQLQDQRPEIDHPEADDEPDIEDVEAVEAVDADTDDVDVDLDEVDEEIDDEADEESDDEAAPAPTPTPSPTPSPVGGAAPAHVRPRHTPPSRDLADTWVVEVWIDPDWYAVQETEEACPSPGLPDVVVVRRNVVLVGRPSGSLGVRPDVDSGADSAVSRRHAQLTSDGSRWWIEDLGSSNGTYVGSVGEPLPTEPIRQRVEIDRDDRIYVGAWTRLVLRQATAAERDGQG